MSLVVTLTEITEGIGTVLEDFDLAETLQNTFTPFSGEGYVLGGAESVAQNVSAEELAEDRASLGSIIQELKMERNPVANPLSLENNNMGDPLTVPELSNNLIRQPAPVLQANSKIGYLQIRQQLQNSIVDVEEMTENILASLTSPLMQPLYERAPLNRNGLNYLDERTHSVYLHIMFQIRTEDGQRTWRTMSAFPLPLIRWRGPRGVSARLLGSRGVPGALARLQSLSIEDWKRRVRAYVQEQIENWIENLQKGVGGSDPINVQAFEDSFTLSLVWRGDSRPQENLAQTLTQLAQRDIPQQAPGRAPRPMPSISQPRTRSEVASSERVGCASSSKEISQKGSYVLWSTKTKKKRCAVYCVLKKLGLGAPVIDEKGSAQARNRRDQLVQNFLIREFERDQTTLEFPLAIEHFWRMADYFCCQIQLYSWSEERKEMIELRNTLTGELCKWGDEKLPFVPMLIEQEHAFLIVKDRMESLDKKVCPHCRTLYKDVHTKCDPTKIAFLNRRLEKNKVKISAHEKFVTSINNRRCIFFDCETFTNEEGEHIPYAIGWGYPSEESRGIKRKNENDGIAPIDWIFAYEWGEGCMSRFMEWLEQYHEKTEKTGKKQKKPAKKILIGFNNANYDNLLLAKTCLAAGMHFDFQIQNNALIGMTAELFKTWDLCRFLPGQSLDSACKSFGASDADAKTCFPHKFIRGWQDLTYVGVEPGPEYHWKPPQNWNYITTPTWNLKEVCLNYLEKDIRSTIFVFNKLQETCFEALRVDIKEFITASHMSFDVWTNLVSDANKETNRFNPFEERKEVFDLYFPTLEQENIFRQAIYGGRTYNTSRSYESSWYSRIEAGEKVDYNQIDEWMDVFDVVSLYASAMLFYDYPCGEASSSTREELDQIAYCIEEEMFDNLPMGIYQVRYKTNKKLIIPALPRKTFRKKDDGSVIGQGLIWDLQDSEGYYTIVDIIESRKQGYHFEFISGVQWEKKGAIFKKYIELALELKCRGEQEGNETLRSLGKLLCNALYGKMLQRPILENSALISDGNDLDKFLTTNNLKEIIFLNDQDKRLLVVGEECQKELKIRKPSFIGAFVLSYSRKIMHNFAGMADPFRGTNQIEESRKNSFLYTDTDSLFYITTPKILASLEPVLKENQPGSLWYDLKGKPIPKVVKAIFLGPKTYMLIYYTKDGKLQVKMRSKGIPSSYLTKDDYINLLENSVVEKKEVPQIRKMMKSNKEQVPFTLIATKVQKCLMKKLWKGRYFVNHQESLPFGHELVPETPLEEELFSSEII